jgi:hypothetical protein
LPFIEVRRGEWTEKQKEFVCENLEFPVLKYPEKPVSLNLKKTLNYEGKLVGVKGQYLIFEDQTVFNVRGNEGIVISLSIKTNPI